MLTFEELRKLFFMIQLINFSLTFLLNCTGILVTYLNPKKTNQNVILFYLSLTEIIFALSASFWKVSEWINILSSLAYDFMFCITLICGIQIFFMMHILTCDRLVCLINPFKYKLRVTKTKIHISFVVTSIISTSIVTVYKMHDNYLIYALSLCVIGFAYLLLAMATYTMLFYVLRKSKKQFKAPSTRKSTKKRFVVPGIIILTFLSLYCLPYSIFNLWLKRRIDDHESYVTQYNIVMTIMYFGLVTDPLTYIFLTKHYRNVLAKLSRNICVCKCTENRIGSQNTTSIELPGI